MKLGVIKKATHWQKALQDIVTDPRELFQLLEINENLLEEAYSASKLFPLKVPRQLIQKIKKGDINDPILRQILPLGIEQVEQTGYSKDPLGENAANPVPGLLHKYQGRVLLTLTGTCGVHCRYCFRRHFPYENNNPGTAGWGQALEYIRADASISEVILSGGDPLVVSDYLLQEFTHRLNEIPHLKRLRIHSRLPIVLPERITDDFIDWAANSKLKIILVLHCNHPQELDPLLADKMKQLITAGTTLLNQAVLLRGVNDSVATLVELSETLFAANILPYYLHLLDKVQGAAHFDMPKEQAQQLHRELTEKLPGFLVPKLVCEQSGAPAKISLESLSLYTG